jgi:hypothetical protein
MDTGRIMTRSVEIMWKYKFLWLFGLVMGLTGGGGSTSGSGNFNINNRTFDNLPPDSILEIQPALVAIGIVVGLVLMVVVLALFFYFRFVARGALVSAVRDIEEHGNATLHEAWSRGRTFYTRLLGLGFLVNAPLAVFTILIILVAFVPLFGAIISSGQQGDAPGELLAGLGITGVFAICCAILCLVIVTFIIHPIYEFAVRAIVLEDLHVREGLRRGYERVRTNLGNVIVLYLLLILGRIGWAIVCTIVLVPILLVLGLIGFGALRQDVNALVVLLLLSLIPLWLLLGALEGIFQLFESNVWTEAYLSLLNKTSTA